MDNYAVAAYNSCARIRLGATDRRTAAEVVFPVTAREARGEQPLPVEQALAQAWDDAHVAMDRLESLSHAFEEALHSLQLATEWSAETSTAYSSCLAVIARLLHKEAEEVRWLTLSLLDEHSRQIVQSLLGTIDEPAELRFDGPGRPSSVW